MPSSQLLLAAPILAMVDAVNHQQVLDVGPGHGKYGLLVREYVRGVARVDAVEAERRYLDKFPWLVRLYDRVYISDVCSLLDVEFARYDVVLMIDVIEHMEQHRGADLLARIPGRVIVCTPAYFFQNPEADQGWETERHRSLWSVDDIAQVRKIEVVDEYAPQIGGVLVRTAPL